SVRRRPISNPAYSSHVYGAANPACLQRIRPYSWTRMSGTVDSVEERPLYGLRRGRTGFRGTLVPVEREAAGSRLIRTGLQHNDPGGLAGTGLVPFGQETHHLVAARHRVAESQIDQRARIGRLEQQIAGQARAAAAVGAE